MAQRLPDFLRPGPDRFLAGELFEGGKVDRGREGPDPDLACRRRAVGRPDPGPGEAGGAARRGGREPDQRTAGGQPGGATARAQEVHRITPPLESEQVRAEQALDDLPAPRKLSENLIARKRDVREEADAHVAALLPHHRRDQLELVVVHPHRGVGGGPLGYRPREPPVDPYVRFHHARWNTGGTITS